jgi:methyltransferase (TIGR00027 family)
MEKGRASRTAAAAAATRAEHHLYAASPIFEDTFAIEFADPLWRSIVEAKPLKWFVFDVLMRLMSPVGGQIVARSRYAEDQLAQAIAAGTRQYVIVGAGFDSFALRRRDLQSILRVYELDHPDTQAAKVERVQALDADLPDNLEFVAIDFEREGVAEALKRSRFEQDSPAFFSWLGTTPYLTNSATLDTLASIVRIGAPGSEVVFDYLVPDEVLSSSDRRVVAKLKRFTARRGEPLVGELHPAELEKVLASIGLELVENLSGPEQEKRYFANRDDGLRPWAASWFAHARVP